MLSVILRHHLSSFLFLGLLAFSQVTFGRVIILADSPFPWVLLRVGSAGATVNTVQFNVPAALLGTGIPLPGDASIDVMVRTRFSSPTPISLLADSSGGLVSGTNSIPFSQISWVSSDGDIPAGTFTGTSAQIIYQFNQSQLLTDTLSFQYNNTLVPVAGDYLGRVRYTVVLP